MAASIETNNDGLSAFEDEIRKLMAKKDEIEKEIKELNDVLLSQGGVGMDGPLVDSEQFPRSDIDIYSVRHARNRIVCLQTDHKELMKLIEENLYKLHEQKRNLSSDNTRQESMDVDTDEGTRPTLESLQPFAVVDKVDIGSPAETAGVQLGDNIVSLGSVSINNFKNLVDVGKAVQHSIGKSLPFVVIRNNRLLRLSVVPNTWSGRGLLGCNIVPLKND